MTQELLLVQRREVRSFRLDQKIGSRLNYELVKAVVFIIHRDRAIKKDWTSCRIWQVR